MQPLVDKKQLLHDTIGYILEEGLIEEMSKIAKIRETIQDEIIIHVGDELKMIPIVVYGSIKVSRENHDGDELLLYYIEGGDTCAMTLQCCVRRTDSQIKATAMEPSLLLMFPSEYMQLWMDKYRSWREYILQSYHTRMLELMETIDEIGREFAEEFYAAGGKRLFLCPCLNDHPAWIEAMSLILREEGAGWLAAL